MPLLPLLLAAAAGGTVIYYWPAIQARTQKLLHPTAPLPPSNPSTVTTTNPDPNSLSAVAGRRAARRVRYRKILGG